MTELLERRGWAAFALVLFAYVLAEAGFNLYLVETAASPKLAPEDVEQLARYGKLLAGFGLALFTVRFAVWRLLQGGATVTGFVFFGLWGFYYAGLVEVFDAILDRVPVEIQQQSLELLTLRQAIFQGDLTSASLRPVDRPRGIAHKLHAVNLPLQLIDARRVDRVLERVDGWRRDQAAKAADALARARLAEAWAVYAATQVGALPGETTLCRAEMPAGAIAITAATLPSELDRTEFEGRYLKQVQPCLIAQILPTLKGGDVKAATAALFLPPMSMTLSLIAMAVNAAACLGVIVVGLAGGRLWARRVGQALSVLALVLPLVLATRSPFVEGSLPFRLHSELPERLGPIGWLWAQAINAQAIVLEFEPAFIISE